MPPRQILRQIHSSHTKTRSPLIPYSMPPPKYRNPNIKFQPDALKLIYTGTVGDNFPPEVRRVWVCLSSIPVSSSRIKLYLKLRESRVSAQAARRILVTSPPFTNASRSLFAIILFPWPHLGLSWNKISTKTLRDYHPSLSPFQSTGQPIKITKV